MNQKARRGVFDELILRVDPRSSDPYRQIRKKHVMCRTMARRMKTRFGKCN